MGYPRIAKYEYKWYFHSIAHAFGISVHENSRQKSVMDIIANDENSILVSVVRIPFRMPYRIKIPFIMQISKSVTVVLHGVYFFV